MDKKTLNEMSVIVKTDKPAIKEQGVTLLIPAHNEEGGIAAVINDAKAALIPYLNNDPSRFEVFVVDDASTDATAQIAKDCGATVRTNKENLGYGASLKAGLRRAKFENIIITDGDDTYPAEVMPTMLDMLENCDQVVGARTGANVHIPWERKHAKIVLRKFAEYLACRKIDDLNSGLRAFKRDDALRFKNLYPAGFSFSTTITLAYLSNDLEIQYLPIDYRKRVGKSKLRPIRDTKNLFMTVFRCTIFFNPMRVAWPLTCLLSLIGLLVLLFARDSHGNILDSTVMLIACITIQVLLVGFIADLFARSR